MSANQMGAHTSSIVREVTALSRRRNQQLHGEHTSDSGTAQSRDRVDLSLGVPDRTGERSVDGRDAPGFYGGGYVRPFRQENIRKQDAKGGEAGVDCLGERHADDRAEVGHLDRANLLTMEVHGAMGILVRESTDATWLYRPKTIGEVVNADASAMQMVLIGRAGPRVGGLRRRCCVRLVCSTLD